MEALYTYAVDGSGRDMRVPVIVLDDSHYGAHDQTLIEFTGHVPKLDRYAELGVSDPKRRIVYRNRLTEPGSYAPLASFNFLD